MHIYTASLSKFVNAGYKRVKNSPFQSHNSGHSRTTGPAKDRRLLLCVVHGSPAMLVQIRRSVFSIHYLHMHSLAIVHPTADLFNTSLTFDCNYTFPNLSFVAVQA
jgi:hypothetical protein